jgi:hypothetical protein
MVRARVWVGEGERSRKAYLGTHYTPYIKLAGQRLGTVTRHSQSKSFQALCSPVQLYGVICAAEGWPSWCVVAEAWDLSRFAE